MKFIYFGCVYMYIQVDIDMGELRTDRGYSDSNILVLPTEKKKRKFKEDNTKKSKKLTKKERKRLETVVKQKAKKANVSSDKFVYNEVQHQGTNFRFSTTC